MRIQILDGEIVLADVYNGIGIQTDMGIFGIAQRDGGVEVMLNGKSVWTSHEIPEPLPSKATFHETAATGLDRARAATLQRHFSFDHNDNTPGARQRRGYVLQAIESIDAARRILHEAFLADNPLALAADSPYYRSSR